jgi:hypothetical protein
MCGSLVPCAVYYQSNPFNYPLTTQYSFTFSLATGYNLLYLNQSIIVRKGYFLLVNQTIGKIAIDTSGSNALYSDLQLSTTTNLWTKLSSSSNYRLYLDTINNFKSYQNVINVSYTYANIGIYTITFTFPASNQQFQQIVNITDCKIILLK